MPRLGKPVAIDPETMTLDERRIRQSFINQLHKEYELSPSDGVIVELAASELIIALRSQEKQLRSGEVLAYSRQDPLSKLTRLLTLLGASRRQRMDARPVESQDETELRSLLMGIGQVPIGNGRTEE